MRVIKIVSLACVLGLFFMGSSFAVTRYVNVSNAAPAAPFTNWAKASTNIQLAINAAVSGDEILVAPGVYRTTSEVWIPPNKRLTLRSTVSRAAVLDAQRRSSVLGISATNSVVEGFTIQNGFVANGDGGGITLDCPGTVRDCLVISNQARIGAGILMYTNPGVVENCTIQYNLATEIGGGIRFANGLVNTCIISDNIASNDGGGAYCQTAAVVSNSLIFRNRAMTGSGGGVYMEFGGRLVNSVVLTNQSAVRGGGVYADYDGMVAHCTLVDNVCAGQVGGLWMDHSTSWNNIVYYNWASIANDFLAYTSVVSNNCTPQLLGGSNFTNEPMFVNRNTWNLQLMPGSPCIDTGATNPAVNIDRIGKMRPRPGTVFGPARYDVGAYEFVPDWDLGYTDVGGGWRRLSWFGDYIPIGGAGRIWHNKHGFFYVPSNSTPQNVWLYAKDMGWLYTGSLTYPYIYRVAPAAWLWYNGSTNPRWFRDMSTGIWESWP